MPELPVPRDGILPVAHSRELRCYLRDPDAHLIEVGQLTTGPTPKEGTTP